MNCRDKIEKTEIEVLKENIKQMEHQYLVMADIVANITKKMNDKVISIAKTVENIENDIIVAITIKRENQEANQRGVTIGHLQKCLTERNNVINDLKVKYEDSRNECAELRQYISNMREHMHRMKGLL